MTTTPLQVTESVQHTVRGWNLLRLEQIRRTLHATDPGGLGARRVTELRNALGAAGAADSVLIDPRFGRWCAEMGNLLDRGAPALLPTGRFRAACRDAGAFTLGARFLHRQDAPATVVRVDHNGELHLPGTGLIAGFGIGHAGLDASIEIRDGRLVPTDATAVIRTESVVLPGLVAPSDDLVDLEPCAVEPLLTTSPPSVVVERGDIDLRSTAVPGIAIVPARAASIVRTAHAMAAAAHLRATAHGALLFESAASVADPPPEVAHIADAPHLVRLLALYRVLPPVADDELGSLLDLFAGWLTNAGSLSPLGGQLLTELSLYGYPIGEDHDFGNDERGPTDRSAPPEWQRTWIDAHGELRETATQVSCLTSADPKLTTILADLGAAAGIEVNSIADGRSRADPTMDHLSLVSVREPLRYTDLVERLATVCACPASEVIRGHMAYVEERFADAAAIYAELLLHLPYDIDLWRDFIFTLRHLGSVELYETAVFRLAEVVDRAMRCQLDLAIFDRLRPDSGRWQSAPPSVRLLVSLLEWMAHDSDHR